ncbi:MAG: SWIM zinc finger family protein [Pseudomonadota bacterium]
MTLTADQILALAPDASSAKAGSQLALPAKWGKLGRSEAALWGECQGSGKDPYRTQIDCSEPAFKCSCPSRKFPCKHGLGLYLLLAAQPALFAEGVVPPWVNDWLQGRQQRSEKKLEAAAEKTRDQTPEQAAAAAAQTQKREEKREAKVARGLSELQTWLQDLAREGLATVRQRGPAPWEAIAARMVDAQAGGLSGRLRRAGNLCFQTTAVDWERQLGHELASIYMLSRANLQAEHLPAGLRDDVRAMVGWSVSQDDVLAPPGLRDRWQVLAQRIGDEERVRVRATWLRGVASARWALVLHFAVGTQGFEHPLAVGTQFDGELNFYPGAWPLRALIKRQDSLDAAVATPFPPLEQSLHDYADALALNPFLERYPLALDGVVPDIDGQRAMLRCADGTIVPLHPSFNYPWQLLALSGGYPVAVVGEWDGDSLLPLSVWAEGRLHNLESDVVA